MKAVQQFSLPRTSALYLFLIVLVVIPAIALLAFQPAVDNAWCRQFEIPEYERTLGFKLGEISVIDGAGTTRGTTGVVWIAPGGAFARAGVRVGDFPRMHHGIRDLCWTLSRAAKGHAVQFEVVNLADVGKNEDGERRILLRPTHP